MYDIVSILLLIMKHVPMKRGSERHQSILGDIECLHADFKLQKDAESQHLLTTTPPSNMHPTIVVPVLVAFGNGTPLACNAALRVWLEKSKPGMLTGREELESSY